MHVIYLTQFNTEKNKEKKIVLPKTDDVPLSASEKLVKEEIRKLTQNSEEIRKLKEQLEKKQDQN